LRQSLGIKLPGLVPSYAASFPDLVDLVVEFERMGFDDVMDSEHIFFAPEMHHPGGSGQMVHGRDRQQSDRADPLVLFAAIAARTQTIRMTTGLLLAAGHRFAVLARQAATLDRLSGGRFVLGVGAGWFAGEFVTMGIPPSERGERLEETIRACLSVWSPGLSSFEGKWIHFRDVISEPAPLTEGGVPVWWGGDGQRGPTARRVAELGQGWISREAADYEEVARSISRIVEVCDQHGRDTTQLGFRASLTATPSGRFTGDPDELIESAVASGLRLADAGVTHFTIPLNYYGLGLDDLGRLLKALRTA
jgi:probable F420-dependent oxidoreductase